MNKIKLALTFIALLFAAWLATWFGLFNFIDTSNPTPVTIQNTNEASVEASQVTVVIDFGDGKTVTGKVVISELTTAYSALTKLANENDIEIETKQYDFGVFVQSIDSHESSSEKAWIYYVNGESGTVAADKKEVVGTDIVEWKYLTPSEE